MHYPMMVHHNLDVVCVSSYHSSRPGHDLRYALSGDKMRDLGWTPAKSVRERIAQVTKWTLENERWIKI